MLLSRQHTKTRAIGLEAQRHAVQQFVQQFVKSASILAEFVEVESGKNNDRSQLHAAIAEAKRTQSTLVIAKLDRLSRNAAFIFMLRDSGVEFVCADMPDANTLTIGIFAVLAQHERELISQRTRAALAAKKAQGFRLGTPANLTDEARKRSIVVRRERIHTDNKTVLHLITLYTRLGLNPNAIAAKLNTEGYRTRNGGAFHRQTVVRLRAYLPAQ